MAIDDSQYKIQGDKVFEKYFKENWYDKFFKWLAIILLVGTILFWLVGGSYCELAPGAPYC